MNYDEPKAVIPAQAGIQSRLLNFYRVTLDSRLRGNDEIEVCGCIKVYGRIV